MNTPNPTQRLLFSAIAVAATLMGCASQGTPPPVIPLDEPVMAQPLSVTAASGLRNPQLGVGLERRLRAPKAMPTAPSAMPAMPRIRANVSVVS